MTGEKGMARDRADYARAVCGPISMEQLGKLDLEGLMRRAIRLAQQARNEGGFPFGALICDMHGRILLEGLNTVLVHGDVETVRTLARNNIDTYEKKGCEYLITGCGSCGGAWQHDYTEILAGDPVYGPKAELWAKRTYDISTFLTKVIELRQPKGEIDKVVTYHDSCHLKKSMKVFTEPREIIKSIPGIIFKEMKAPDTCCGSGGSYVVTHYHTASDIGQKKAADIQGTGADAVSVGCPACMMQLLDNVRRAGGQQEIVHFISLLAESYRREQ